MMRSSAVVLPMPPEPIRYRLLSVFIRISVTRRGLVSSGRNCRSSSSGVAQGSRAGYTLSPAKRPPGSLACCSQRLPAFHRLPRFTWVL